MTEPADPMRFDEILEHLDDLMELARAEGFVAFAVELAELHLRIREDPSFQIVTMRLFHPNESAPPPELENEENSVFANVSEPHN